MPHSTAPEQQSGPGYLPALQAARQALAEAQLLAAGRDGERVAWLVQCVDQLIGARAAAATAARQPETAGELQEGDEVDQVVGRRTLTHVVKSVAPGPYGVVTVYFIDTFQWVMPVGRPVTARRPQPGPDSGGRGE